MQDVFHQAPFGEGRLEQVGAYKGGGRGGGSRDFAQGGAPAGAIIEDVLDSTAAKITNSK